MRILLVHNYYKVPGGEDTVFKNELELLSRHGHSVYTYIRNNNDMKPWQLLTEAIYSRKTYREISKLIKSKKIDIVHVHNTQFLISPSVFRAARDSGVPVVQTLHNFRMVCVNAMLYREGRVCGDCLKKGVRCGIINRCYRGSLLLSALLTLIRSFNRRIHSYDGAAFICLTDFNKNVFISGRRFFGKNNISAASFFVKPNFFSRENDRIGDGNSDSQASKQAVLAGSDLAPLETPESRVLKSRLPAMNSRCRAKSQKQFLFVGRLEPLKGIDDIIREWRRVPSDCRLLICGSGEDKAFMKKLERLSKGMPNVEFLGRQEHDRTLSLMASSAALIFASKWYEGFPMTIIESFAMGTPVIGLDFGNGGDLIADIYGSRKPLLRDISELPRRIWEFKAEDYAFKKAALEKYSPEANYKILTEIYRTLLGR